MRIFHSIFFIMLGFTLVISLPVLFAKDKEETIPDQAEDFANKVNKK